MKKIVLKVFLILVFIVGINQYLKAQDIPPDPDEIPLDPGSWVLVAAGVGYGVKKWRDSKQKINKNGGNETTSL